MPWWGICLIIFVTFITFAILHFLGKNKHPFKRSLLSMTLGAYKIMLALLTKDKETVGEALEELYGIV